MCTAPKENVGELADKIVELNLGACVNVLEDAQSIYIWQSKLEKSTESLMVIKTIEGSLPALTRWLEENHPYDVPEVIAIPIIGGSSAYLDWVHDACSQ